MREHACDEALARRLLGELAFVGDRQIRQAVGQRRREHAAAAVRNATALNRNVEAQLGDPAFST